MPFFLNPKKKSKKILSFAVTDNVARIKFIIFATGNICRRNIPVAGKFRCRTTE